MTGDLSECQREALERYRLLVAEWPDLFTGRERRPIVLDEGELAGYAREHGVVLGVVAATPYLWLLNDLVRSGRGGTAVRHPYLRLMPPPGQAPANGVVVLATVAAGPGEPESVVMVEQDRHATGATELELPRGFGAPGVEGAAQALEELATETGWVGERAEHLGSLLPDSGSRADAVDYFHVEVSRRDAAAPEIGESIVGVRLLPRDEVWDLVRRGAIRDGFTVQALALYERSGAALGREL